MADFKQAVKWMKEGKKVTRTTWTSKTYNIYLEEGCVTFYTGEAEHQYALNLHLGDIEATDWEIYEEDNWDLLSEWGKIIKTLKEKLKEDIAKKLHHGECGKENLCIDITDLKDIIDKRFGDFEKWY